MKQPAALHAALQPPFSPFTFEPSRRRSYALAALLAIACVGLGTAHADEAETHVYQVPSGPLEQALARFAAQAGVHLSIAPSATDDKFSGPLNGNYTRHEALRQLLAQSGLVATALGQDEYLIEPADAQARTSFPAASALQLQPVVVTASAGGVTQEVREAPASISIVTHDELVNRPYRDIADALSSVPGVISTGGNDRKDISIRGMGPEYTLTLIDGKRTDSRETTRLSDGWGQMNAWTPPASAIERIEVVRGPMSALYGADAMGGVINIITRKVATQWNGEASLDTLLQQHSASGNATQGSFFLSGPLVQDRLGLQVYGQSSQRDEDKIPEGYRDSDRQNVTGKLAFTPSADHDFTLEANHSQQQLQREPGKSIDPSCVLTSYFGCADPYKRKVEVDRFSLSHTGRWAFGTSQSHVQQERFEVSPQDIELKNTELRTAWALPLTEQHLLTVGGGSNRAELHDSASNTITSTYDIVRTQTSAFVEDNWSLTDTFTLTGGARLDDDSRFGKHWSPRLYGVWDLDTNWTLKGGITSGFKSPELTQVAPNYASESGAGNLYGNAGLKPEKSLNQEIGLLYEQDGLTGGVTLFNTKFKDKITSRACQQGDACFGRPGGRGYFGPLTPQTYANVDRAITRGVEATLGLPLSTDLRLDNSYTYTYSRQQTGDFRGKPLNKLPQHLLASTLNYQATDRLSTWTRLTYRGKESDNVGSFEAVLRPVEAPSYTLLDAGATYELSKNLSLRGAIYNLGDKKVRYDDYGYVEDGRRYWLGLTARF